MSNKWLALTGLAILLAGPASAGLEDSAKKSRPTKVESMARVVDNSSSSALRCYQHGKMVFEGTGVSPVKATKSVSVFKGQGGRSIQLVDLNDGFCILDTNG